MRLTWRTFFWEYAPCVYLPACILTLPFCAVPERWASWVVFGLGLVFLTCYVGHLLVLRKYPARGDLPEFKEYWRRRREEFGLKPVEKHEAD